MRYEGKPALGVQVSMVKGGNVLQLGDALAAELDRIKADLPAGVEVHDVAFQPRVVKESVNEFQRSFAEALVIVLIVSFVSLGWRTGIVVALSVPLVVGIVLMVMSAAGMNLDRISLGALIIALGLLVDDAIIAVEMMVVKMEQGWDRAPRRDVCLDVDGVSHAHRHADHRRGVLAGRLREVVRGASTPAGSSGWLGSRSSRRGSSPWCSRRTSA